MPNKNKNAARLGKLGGKSTSDAKRNAAKINGSKGGRPRKMEYVPDKTTSVIKPKESKTDEELMRANMKHDTEEIIMLRKRISKLQEDALEFAVTVIMMNQRVLMIPSETERFEAACTKLNQALGGHGLLRDSASAPPTFRDDSGKSLNDVRSA
jgi:hypothetical protein